MQVSVGERQSRAVFVADDPSFASLYAKPFTMHDNGAHCGRALQARIFGYSSFLVSYAIGVFPDFIDGDHPKSSTATRSVEDSPDDVLRRLCYGHTLPQHG
jgi:hypothetical protein